MKRSEHKPYKRPNPLSLAGWIMDELIDTVGAAMRDAAATDKANIEAVVSAALSELLNSPRFKFRAKSAGATERMGMEREYKKIIAALVDLHAAPPDVEQFPAAMFAKWPDMKSEDIDVRMRAADPKTIWTLMRAGAETAIDDATAALAETAGDSEAPNQQSLAAWIAAGECPAEVLRDVADRLAALVDVKPDAVSVTGWAFGGLIVRHGGNEIPVPARQIKDIADRRKVPKSNPLAPLVRAWNERPKLIIADKRPGILPRNFAHVDRTHKRAGGLFTPAADLVIEHDGNGQLIMSAVAGKGSRNPTLPPTLWGLGELPTRGGPGEAIATRLWVYAVTRVNRADWRPDQTLQLAIPMRDLKRLAPNRNLSISQLRHMGDVAAEALASPAAAWPYIDPATNEPGGWRVVNVRAVGHSLDAPLLLEVSIPPGVAKHGPTLPAELDAYGANSKYAYRGLITASFDWNQPGTTLIPNEPRRWDRGHHQARDPDAYAVFTFDEIVDALAPRTSRKHRADIKGRIIKALGKLHTDGLIHLESVGRREIRMLPPGLWTPTTGESEGP